VTTFREYQQRTADTAIYPDAGKGNFVYPALGLAGETGEVAEQIKKAIRDDQGVITFVRQEVLVKELGDVLWYISQLATEAGISLDDVARRNLTKLADRKVRGVLHGSGNDR
jgi:NTP pyrophosphatase (non-canonical NTP hydrolase)